MNKVLGSRNTLFAEKKSEGRNLELERILIGKPFSYEGLYAGSITGCGPRWYSC